MRRLYLLACLAAFGFVGCQQTWTPTPAPVANTPAAAVEAEEPAVAGTLVVLKLPNMVCDGCAGEVKKGLKTVAGIANIKTDPAHNVCKFIVTDETLDWKAKLAELNKDNSHLDDWAVVEGG